MSGSYNNLTPYPSPPSPAPQRRSFRRVGRGRRKGWGVRQVLALLFFLGGIALLIFGISSIGAGFVVREPALPNGMTWQTPLEQVNNRALVPATALLPLTGASATDALNAALDGGHWENAFALLAYDSSLPDPTRIGALLQLGSRYAAERDKVKAAWCYLYASRIATLSPMLSDGIREDTYLQVSAGLRAIGATDAARLATDQAYTVAEYSPVLQRDPQSRRMNQVANAYAALGLDALANEARGKANESVALASDDAGFLPREPFVVKVAALPTTPDLDAALKTRIAAAKQLSDDVQKVPANRPGDWPSDSAAQLREALLNEDAARGAFYNQTVAVAQDPAVGIAIWRDRVNWLALKYRIARGAFGADLVPEWSKNASVVAQAWNDAWEALLDAYATQASAIPNAQAVSQATEDVLRQELFALRWGGYRAKSESDLRAEVADVTDQLRQQSIVSLRVDSLTANGVTTDWLSPDELFGKNARPK